jgi:hypothetical protein
LDNLVTLCRYHHRELHRGKFFLAVKPLSVNQESHTGGENVPQRFVDRLCFSTVERYFDAPFNRPPLRSNEDQVIARNPARFTCACCDGGSESQLNGSELKQALPGGIFEGIDAHTAVTKWAGERMDLGMAVEGLLRVSRIGPCIG